MTYVLDTNVVSALRVPGRHPAVAAWADSVQVAEQFVVAITLAEIERGVIAKERTDPTQSEHLRRWFDDKVLRIFVFARRGTNLIMQPLAGSLGSFSKPLTVGRVPRDSGWDAGAGPKTKIETALDRQKIWKRAFGDTPPI